MGQPEAQAIYRRRAASAELVNAKAVIDDYCTELKQLMRRPDKLILGRPGLRIVGTGPGQ